MNKFQEVREAIKKTPADRLAKIEYQSHFMQMIGVSVVCGILIWQGFWWIIFAFIFSLGISLSQGISAYQKYIAILPYMDKKVYDPHKDKSPSRRRDYIIKQTFGKHTWIFAVILSVFLNIKFIPHDSWQTNILFSFLLLFFYIVIYFFFFFFFANKIYNRGKNK